MQMNRTKNASKTSQPLSTRLHDFRVRLIKLRTELTALERGAGDAAEPLESAFEALMEVDDLIGEAHGIALSDEIDVPAAAA
jgi:hypothetical protein